MKLIRSGTMYDPWNGDGWFIALSTTNGHFTFAVRYRWHLRYVKPPGKPGYRRVYIGPFEFEWSTQNPTP